MDWKKVKEVPKYNPFQFQLARKTRAAAKYEIARRAKLSTKKISDIENGLVLPTDIEAETLANVLYYPISFFENFEEFTVEFTGCIGRNVQIDYYKYKIFRDINPPQMQVA